MEKILFLEVIHADNFSDDSDHTKLSRKFYTNYWGNTLSADINDYCGEKGLYRGETIISFMTIAGCAIRMIPDYNECDTIMPQTREGRIDIIQSTDKISDELKEKFTRFLSLYRTLANFMPFINAGRQASLNLVKNRSYHDYPDLFMNDVRNYYIFDEGNTSFQNTLNKSYFSKFNSWKNYVEKNYFQDFFKDEEYTCPIQLAPINAKLPYKAGMTKRLTEAEIIENYKQIDIFLTNAISIIEKRAKRLADSSQVSAAERRLS